jgi:plastocyanin
MSMRSLRPLVLAASLALASACGGEKKDAAPSGPPPGAQKVDESKAGNLAGRVVLEGPAPANAPIQISADPFCMRANKDGSTFETYVVDNGGLENVFVYVKDGLGNYYFDVPTEPVTLDQKGCRYVPHVFGIRAGQPLEISNSDDTLHNVHALAEKNQEFNYGQAMAGMKNTRTFTVPEVMIRFKCDVHGWMNAYGGVVNHPYFAVTKDGGRFELKNVPAGTYTIEAWHEKLGTQTQSVTIGEKQSKDITFTFKSPAAGAN